MIYSVVRGGPGGIMRYRNKTINKFVSKKDIPANVLKLLSTQDEVDDSGMQLERPNNECVFCGMATKLSRIVNQQTVAICEQHYHSESLGRIAQQVRINEEADKG